MARPFPQSPAVIRRIMRLAKQGKSCRHIAGVVGLSRTTVSNIAKKEGHVWGAVNTKKAAAANHAYGSERRAEQEVTGAGRLDDVFKRMDKPTRVHSFSMGSYVEHVMPEPDSRALADLSRAAQMLMTTMKMLHNYEGVGDAGGSVIDEWVESMRAKL